MPALRPIHLVRYGLPGAILLAGLILIFAGSGSIASAAGEVLIGVSLMVYLVNVLARLAVASQGDREREQRARDQLTRSGGRETPPARSGGPETPARSGEREARSGDREAPASSVERHARRRLPGRPKRPRGARQRSEH